MLSSVHLDLEIQQMLSSMISEFSPVNTLVGLIIASARSDGPSTGSA
jgi:hypothetical protein